MSDQIKALNNFHEGFFLCNCLKFNPTLIAPKSLKPDDPFAPGRGAVGGLGRPMALLINREL